MYRDAWLAIILLVVIGMLLMVVLKALAHGARFWLLLPMPVGMLFLIARYRKQDQQALAEAASWVDLAERQGDPVFDMASGAAAVAVLTVLVSYLLRRRE